MKRNRTAQVFARSTRSSRHCAIRSQELRARRFFRPLLEQFEDRRLLAAVLTVNSPLDTNVRDSVLTFRESILVSNRTLPVATLTAAEQAQVSGTPTSADTDTIGFDIPGTGVQSISTATALPALTDPVVIDGYTQPGASANTLAVGSDAVLLVEVFSTTNQTGLVLSGGGSTVRGMVLNRFFDAVSVISDNNVIEGNFIGIAADGATDRDNQFSGVRVTAGSNNLIGGVTPAARNVMGGRGFFSGNSTAQIAIGKTSPAAPSVVGTTIRGNYIGINAAGTAPISTASFLKAGVSITDAVNTIIGGTDADDGVLDGNVGARNIFSGNNTGVRAEGTSNSNNFRIDGLVIQGNFVGVNAAGTSPVPNGNGIFAGNAATTTDLQIGGTAPGAGNVVSGNRSAGVLAGGLQMTVQGNYIGTDLSGTLDLGNGIDGGSGGEGVQVSLGGNEGPNFQVLIGGTTPAARNIISGNASNGIVVASLHSGSVTIQGNYIGTQADGQTPLPNLASGIEMNRDVTIGGTIAGAANVIAFNAGRGVSATSTVNGLFTATILGNSIHSNGNMGIDLNFSGPSLNDLGDADTNIINNGQNFPVLTGVNAVSGNTVITGRLNSNANSNYRIEFFYNNARDVSGYGEGQTYLGFTDVTTDSSGNVSFVSPVVPGLIPAGRFVTATATKLSTSETSEFSFALASLIVTNTLDSGFGSLREAITMANTFVNFDRDGLAGNEVDPITFAIPGAGVQTITPLSALPAIAEAVSIDGYTQAGASPNTLLVGSNAVLLIELNGTSAGSSANGLTIGGSSGSTVRGLTVNRFGGSGVELVSGNHLVEGSYFGIDPSGTIERSNLFAGVRVNGGTNNRIGGTTTQARNVLAGNGSTTGTAQIVVGSSGTVIRGNYIGVNAAGTAAVHPTASGNDDGIYVARGVATIIGGNDADDGLVDGVVRAGNVISGNLNGIRLDATGVGATLVDGITIQGNIIGLDATGTQDVGNFGDGISAVRAAFTSAASIVQIGGTQPGAGNIIAANDGRGFIGSAANLVLEGNLIGTDSSGTLNFGNGSQGVHILLFGELGLNYQIRVGGTTSATRNVISGNAANGVLVTGETSFGTPVIVIQGNYIGTQADGQSPLPNLLNGVELQRNGSVGGTAAGAGNVIAFNRQRGVNLISGATMPILGNSIFGNGAAGNTLSHLGIDLGGNGLTLNDANDGDFGVNRLQNFPVFSSAMLAAGTVTLQYAVPSSTSNANYPLRIEFFKADVDGQEGQTFLGFDTYTAAEAGTVKTFAFTPAVTLAANDKVVATATDNLGNSSEFSASLAVTVANLPPVITSNGGGDTATIAVPENMTAVTTVAASDLDPGTTLTYSIVGGADAGKFSINATSGVLVFAAAPNFEAPTDADANNSYLVIVQTSDGNLTDSQTLTVTVMNVNEPPAITSNGGGDTASVSVPENTTAVTTVTANDPDSGTTLTYSITGGADAAQFAINPSSGALTFIAAPNFEAPTDAGADNVYDVVVAASDGSLTDSQTLTVMVTNANEPPAITSNGGGTSALVLVAENTTAVTTVTANDPDVGTTLTYSITGGADAGQFAINPSGGALTFIAAPNFEAPTDAGANGVYDVIVQASDGLNTDTQTLAVTVTNVNEAPVITSDGGGATAAKSVPENTMAVTTVTAVDPDLPSSLVFSLAGGADAAKFTIDPSSGALAFLSPPSAQNPQDAGGDNVYDVIVQVSDGALTDTQMLSVTVTNINESPTITSNGGGATANISVAENTTAVTTVTANDPDAGTTLTYSIVGGADAGQFSINATSGALTFVAAPNFEAPTDADANNNYLVIVQASDGSLTDSQTLTVTVTNANELPAITSNGGGDSASISVPENTTAVTTVAAIDPDAGTTIVYTISGGADATLFAINAANGALAFISAPNFEAPTDADANNSYQVIVQASDGSLSDSQTLTVTVTNVNEPPAITSNGGGATANISVAEDTTAVTTVAAVDPDAGTTLTYSISGGVDAAKFTINATTGGLAFVVAPNFESPTDVGSNNVYDVAVQVSDGSLLDIQAISVTVTDVAESAFTISGTVYTDVTGNGKSADDLPWTHSTPVRLHLYRDVNGDGVYQSGDTLLTAMFTSAGGVYSFTPPDAGKYIIKEVIPNHFVRTFPVLNDYVAVNLTTSSSSGNDWYNAEVCDLSVVTNVSYVINHGGVLTTVTDLRGNTREGDIVTANFTVTATHQFTLVTYDAPGPTWDPVNASQQSVFDFETATLTPGSYSLTVDIPKNFYQVDFVCGPYINQLGPAGSNIFYSAQNRLISADNGGVNALNAPAIDLALSTTVDNPTPQVGSNVVLTVEVSNAAGWSAATGVRVKNALPSGLTFVSATTTQGTYNSSSGEWNLVSPLNSGAMATLTITATVATAGEKKSAAQVTAAGAPDIDSTPNNDSSPSTPQNEDDDDNVSIFPQLWTKYFVVNDSSSGSTREKTFEYAPDGTSVENYQLNASNTAPRGAATTAAGNKVWVIDANKKVFVYDATGILLGSWSAGGLSSTATPEGIATNGTDIWIVDSKQDKVFKYTNAANRTSGSQNAASSFALNSGNKNPKDIVASSTHLWVVDDSSTDKVFKYTLAGACLGSWTISGGGGSPTGITLDPANVNHLWVVDKSTDRVYQFNAATSRTSGSQSAASSFALESGNTSPEGIADPPPPAKLRATHSSASLSNQASSNQAFDVALLAVIDELNGLPGSGRRKK